MKEKLIRAVPYIFIGALLITIGIILMQKGVFGNKQEDIKEETNVTPTPEPVKEESKIKIVDTNSKTRPYAVMINCHSAALPQSGLNDAYMVYEIMVEYGITRMFALFKDVDFTKVGSIRSVRNQYLGYAFENDAIIVHAGGSAEADGRISSEKIDHIDVDGQYGQRDKTLAKKRAWEHTLFTNSSLLSKAMKDKGLRSTTDKGTLLTYSENELDLSKYNTVKASKISIKYSNYRTSNYEYDKNNKNYLRSMNNTKNIDLVSGKQYTVKNIIVYGVKYTSYTDHGYSGYQKISNIGTGDGYYITNGLALPITWSKSSEKDKTVYKIKETGEDLIVNDGNTYIQIYPSNGGKLTIS